MSNQVNKVESIVVITSLETVEGLKSSYSEISKVVNMYWKSGVSSKLRLSRQIKKFFDSREKWMGAKPTNDVGAAYYKVETEFLESLPFREKVAAKFNRIGNAAWLHEKSLDVSILPNSYNSLEKLASKEVCGNPEVVDYLKENLSSGASREDIRDLITKATATKPDGDNPDEEPKSDETRNTLLLSIKIDPKTFGKTTGDVAELFKLVKRVNGFIDDMSEEAFGKDGRIASFGQDVFNIQVKTSVFEALLKKAKKSEADSLDWQSVLAQAA